MKPIRILSSYIVWHYTFALTSIYGIWTNFMWFVLNFFSIPELFRTLFAPWTRIHEEYQKGDGVGEFFSDLFVNFIMRIVGFCVRIVTVVIGLVFLLVCFLGGVVFCIIWFLMPLVLVVILGYFIKFLA